MAYSHRYKVDGFGVVGKCGETWYSFEYIAMQVHLPKAMLATQVHLRGGNACSVGRYGEWGKGIGKKGNKKDDKIGKTNKGKIGENKEKNSVSCSSRLTFFKISQHFLTFAFFNII